MISGGTDQPTIDRIVVDPLDPELYRSNPHDI